MDRNQVDSGGGDGLQWWISCQAIRFVYICGKVDRFVSVAHTKKMILYEWRIKLTECALIISERENKF